MVKKKGPKKKNYYQPSATGPSAEEMDESFQRTSYKIEEIDNLPLDQKKQAIRQFLIEAGTDVNRNDNDLTGNGDQSMIATFQKRDLVRQLFAVGGDIHEHVCQQKFHPSMSTFAYACASGFVGDAQSEMKRVKSIESVTQPYSRNGDMLNVLETRETSLRLSPLLLIVSAGKNVYGADHRHRDVAKLLLKHGASPVAQDVFGKSAVHYGCGAYGTKMTLEVADMCIRAAKSHHLFGKNVKLHSLNTESMNGKVGIAGGFDPDSERRAVYLPDEIREVWIKVENISLTDKDKDCKSYPLLSEIQDRFGSTALHELCMSSPSMRGMTENVDAAELLLKKYHTSIYIRDADGMTPFQLCCGMAQMAGARQISKLVMERAALEGRDARCSRKKKELRCANCKVDLDKNAPVCSRCKITCYCCRDCQVSHFSKHKAECKDIAAYVNGVKLNPPAQTMFTATMSFQTGMSHSGGTYQKPRNVKCNEQFVIKVQGNGDQFPIMVYDQTRFCSFDLCPGQPGFKEVLAEIRNEPAWQGRKTFMKASFDENGACTVYPSTAGVKSQYNW
jgi:hypothetical protein